MLESRTPVLPPDEGACSGQPTDWWFPIRHRHLKQDGVDEINRASAKAKQICASCCTRKECLEYSLYEEPLGIWGGLDESERAILRKARGIAAMRAEKVYIPHVGTRSSNGGT